MTPNERALVDRVELVLSRAVAIALPGAMANWKLAKWEDELGPALLALVRRLDAENERQVELMREAAKLQKVLAALVDDRHPVDARMARALAKRLESRA